MRQLILAAVSLLLLWTTPVSPASADDGDGGTVTPGSGGLNAEWLDTTPAGEVPDYDGLPPTDDSAATAAAAAAVPTCGVEQRDIECQPTVICRPEPASPLGGIRILIERGWLTNLGWCDPSAPATFPPTITPAMVLRAFKRIPLPASTIVVQPPDGETLVNFKTNFYTEAERFKRTVTLLGQEVTLDIWPSSYIWHFGDTTSDTTDSPGAPYPDLLVTHEYERTGNVRVSVDTVWSAEFRVNDGARQDVHGTVTIDGATEPLNVLEATPVLTGEYY